MIVTLDGILYGDQFVTHDEYRPWSFNRGYWRSHYYDYLDNLPEDHIQQFITIKDECKQYTQLHQLSTLN